MRAKLLLLVAFAGLASLQAQETNDGAADGFRREAQARAEQARARVAVQVESQVATPLAATSPTQRYPWKTNIVTAVFAIGEKLQKGRRDKSTWDANWLANYGGVDPLDSAKRRDYAPEGFVPRQNPFYAALPYNDIAHGQFKPEAPLVIPWFKQAYTAPGQSVCHGRWLAIRKGNRVCYAQWEDVGPEMTEHFQYVFQNERPKTSRQRGAGLAVSPAVRDFLKLATVDVTDWQFAEVRDVAPGPWRAFGDNNHFVIARQQTEIGAKP